MKAICNKGICVFLFLSLLMSATMVNAQRVITASGKYITKNIKVIRFDQIYLKGSPTIEYTQSPGASKVQIAGSDNLVDLVECRVEGSTSMSPEPCNSAEKSPLQVIFSATISPEPVNDTSNPSTFRLPKWISPEPCKEALFSIGLETKIFSRPSLP